MDSIRGIVKKLRESRMMEASKDYEKMSTEELVQLAQDGDQYAYEILMRNYKDFIGRMSSKYFLGSGDRDDVIQIANIGFWEAVSKWDLTGNFEAYAGMVIKRRLMDEMNKDNAEKRSLNHTSSSLDEPVAGDSDGESSVGDTLSSSELSTEEQVLGREGARELIKYMRDKFSEKEREVVMLYIKGYKIGDIVEETGMKYKAVENTLMRIRNKLTDYIKKPYKESRKIKEDTDIEFSDEEKRVLESVITKVNEVESLRESKEYDKMTAEDIDDILDEIGEKVEDILSDLKTIPYDDRDSQFNQLEDLRRELSDMEDYYTDAQYNRAEDITYRIYKADDIEYEGESRKDPYEERGLKRSDFY